MASAPFALDRFLTLPALMASGDSLLITTIRRGRFEAYPVSIAIDAGSASGLTQTCSGGYSATLRIHQPVSISVSPGLFLDTASDEDGEPDLYPEWVGLHQEHDMAEESILRVRGTANVPALASAISHAVYDGKTVTLRAIGASAISQAIKAVAVARGYVAPRGIDLMLVPGFTNVEMPDGSVTAITLRIVAS